MTELILEEQRAERVANFNPREFRNAMGEFATGVVVISTDVDGEPHGMTANAFMSGSLEPPLIIVSVACTARMHDRIQRAGYFGVSILSEHQEWCSNHFAGKPMEGKCPQFERIGNVPVLSGANVQIATDLEHVYSCGDHTLFVGRVHTMERPEHPDRGLLFYAGRYGKIISKGAPLTFSLDENVYDATSCW
ncbi:MAG: flavin reductase family protein [Advenella sp.]